MPLPTLELTVNRQASLCNLEAVFLGLRSFEVYVENSLSGSSPLLLFKDGSHPALSVLCALDFVDETVLGTLKRPAG